MKRSRLLTTLRCALVALIPFGGCGPRAKLSPELEKANPRVVALLPVIANPNIRAERVAYLQGSIASELKGRGYELLENRIVSQICSIPECPERKRLADQFGVEAFAQLKVDSSADTNFLIGFVNSIRGELVFTSASGVEFVRVANTESERGGLIFNSGQVLQGLKEGVQNFGDTGFNRLAGKFAKTTVSQLPRPSVSTVARVEKQENTAEIKSINVRTIRPLVYEVCVRSQPNMIASMVFRKQRTTLRDIGQGQYCGVYRVNQNLASAKGLAVEVRSPFGEAARQDVQLVSNGPCNLDGLVKLLDQPGARKLVVSCVAVGGKQTPDNECPKMDMMCSAAKILVYRSKTNQGPFEKVAELRDTAWTDRFSSSSTEPLYRVIAVTENGLQSLPVAPVATATAKTSS